MYTTHIFIWHIHFPGLQNLTLIIGNIVDNIKFRPLSHQFYHVESYHKSTLETISPCMLLRASKYVVSVVLSGLGINGG